MNLSHTHYYSYLDILGSYFPKLEKYILVAKNTGTSNVLGFKARNNMRKIVTRNCYLGEQLGEEDYVESYIKDKLNDWKQDIEVFIPIAS